ncbi:MAG: DoxX family protein, partial [Bacteroidales bacterium]|uniref:MauE/DoxX family redox-associated membrane protein n=1 Tax=Porphyromonas sp. TaxID=1924944 RepID=UPI002971B99C|nr:DoxX family protein [Bacteroidales bacterium]MDY3067065.1 DoxX family protein [Porphyromonas sp.]
MRWSKKQIIAALAQLIVGITFIFSGLMKGIDPMGTAIKIEEYVAITGLHLPFWIYLGASVTLNVSEALLGVLLLMGWRRRITRWAAIILMCGMTLLTLYIYIFDPVADCGCFGDALVISNAATFWKNVVLLLFVI